MNFDIDKFADIYYKKAQQLRFPKVWPYPKPDVEPEPEEESNWPYQPPEEIPQEELFPAEEKPAEEPEKRIYQSSAEILKFPDLSEMRYIVEHGTTDFTDNDLRYPRETIARIFRKIMLDKYRDQILAGNLSKEAIDDIARMRYAILAVWIYDESISAADLRGLTEMFKSNPTVETLEI